MSARARGFAWVAFAYLIAIGVGYATAWSFREHGPSAMLGTGYLTSILAIFVFSRAFSNTSFFDAWWTLAPLAALPPLAIAAGVPARAALVATLVTIWALRLTWNWIRGWQGLHQEDWRYLEMKSKTGRAYWLVSLVALHLFPGALVFAGSLSMMVAMLGAAPIGVLDLVATFITGGAIALEAIADAQLHAFAKSEPPKGSTCEVGLWRYSRHPNYFGEMSFWAGLFVFALAADASVWWAIVGPASIIALFLFGTIPMMEKRQMERRRDAFTSYRRRVSMIIPLPPKRD